MTSTCLDFRYSQDACQRYKVVEESQQGKPFNAYLVCKQMFTRHILVLVEVQVLVEVNWRSNHTLYTSVVTAKQWKQLNFMRCVAYIPISMNFVFCLHLKMQQTIYLKKLMLDSV